MYNEFMIKICEICIKKKSMTHYSNDLELKNQFKNKIIKNNYSQAYQDIFILSILNYKSYGTYLEIGSGNPSIGNNTMLLEKDFNWTGVAIEIDEQLSNQYIDQRVNKCINKDANLIDYNILIKNEFNSSTIDYLQIDCDPPSQSYNILTKIPFNKYKFNVITFEHDYYDDKEKKYKKLSVDYLKNAGYVLLVENVAVDKFFPFEDWWVHESLYNENIKNKFENINVRVTCIEEYMLKDFKYIPSLICDH